MNSLNVKKTKVLVVDDEHNIRFLLNDFLTHESEFDVITAESVDEAVELLKKDKVDLIVTDIKMPKKNGYEIIEELKELNLKLPLIFLSGNLNTDTDENLANHPVVNKPIDLDELLEKITAVLQEEKEKSQQST